MSRRHAITTGCALAITALALVPVPATAQPRAANAPAAPGAWKPPAGMIEALQRDLHLTKEQAQTRLVNEARLAGVEADLRGKLGERFAGSWFVGIVAQRLVVATTSEADIPQIVATGARAEIVTRSLADLAAIKNQVDNTPAAHKDTGAVRYIDVRTNKVVVLSKDVAIASNALEASGADPVAVKVEPSDETPDSSTTSWAATPTTSARRSAAPSASPWSASPRTVSSAPVTAASRATPRAAPTGSLRVSSRGRPSPAVTTPGSR